MSRGMKGRRRHCKTLVVGREKVGCEEEKDRGGYEG